MHNFFLAIETSSENCSIGIFKNDEPIDLIEINDGYSHAEVLASSTKKILATQNLNIQDLSAIAVGEGPGSYTGLRIGISFVKGLAFSNHINIIKINSLQSMALAVIDKLKTVRSPNSLLISTVDARRDEIYINKFDADGRALNKTTAHILTPHSFEKTQKQEDVYIYGTGANKALQLSKYTKNFNHIPDIYPTVKGVGGVVNQKFLNQEFENIAYFQPFYLKDFLAGQPKKNKLLP